MAGIHFSFNSKPFTEFDPLDHRTLTHLPRVLHRQIAAGRGRKGT